MHTWTRMPFMALLAAALVGGMALPAAAQFDAAAEKILQKHLPSRQYQATGPKLLGVLVGDPQPILSLEGRSGPVDELCFCYDGLSYRWTYVPTDAANPQISNLSVPIGKDNNGGSMIFPKLEMASLKNCQASGVKTPYTLVEIDVNSGAGSPANDSFVATGIKVIEGSKDFPLHVTKVIEKLKKEYAAHVKGQSKELDAALAKAQQGALKDQKPTGPREQTDWMYVTWLNKDNTLQVRFLSRIQDGSYQVIQGGGPKGPPFPLPVPNPKLPPPPARADVPPAPAAARAAFPPPPPPFFKRKVGTAFGIVYGRIYTVSKDGKVTQTQDVPVESFSQSINANIGPAGPGGGIPLPVVDPKKGR